LCIFHSFIDARKSIDCETLFNSISSFVLNSDSFWTGWSSCGEQVKSSAMFAEQTAHRWPQRKPHCVFFFFSSHLNRHGRAAPPTSMGPRRLGWGRVVLVHDNFRVIQASAPTPGGRTHRVARRTRGDQCMWTQWPGGPDRRPSVPLSSPYRFQPCTTTAPKFVTFTQPGDRTDVPHPQTPVPTHDTIPVAVPHGPPWSRTLNLWRSRVVLRDKKVDSSSTTAGSSDTNFTVLGSK
jgi:hypothetical protein